MSATVTDSQFGYALNGPLLQFKKKKKSLWKYVWSEWAVFLRTHPNFNVKAWACSLSSSVFSYPACHELNLGSFKIPCAHFLCYSDQQKIILFIYLLRQWLSWLLFLFSPKHIYLFAFVHVYILMKKSGSFCSNFWTGIGRGEYCYLYVNQGQCHLPLKFVAFCIMCSKPNSTNFA